MRLIHFQWFKKKLTLLTAKSAEPLKSILLTFEAISKNHYSILHLLFFLSRLAIRFRRFFYQLVGLIVIFFNNNDSGEYKIEGFCHNTIYARESELGHLLRLYYFVSWKRYPEEKNTLEPVLAIQYLKKLINSFHIRNIIYSNLNTLGCSDPQMRQIACQLSLSALIQAGLP